MSNIEYLNCDCIDLMKEYPDKYFDLAIVDPPYGIGMGKSKVSAKTLNMIGKNISKRTGIIRSLINHISKNW